MALIWFILAGINGVAPLTLAMTTLVAFVVGAWLWRVARATFGFSLPQVKRPFAHLSRRQQLAMLVGVLAGVGVAFAIVWDNRQNQGSLWNALIGWGILLALAGGWLGPKVLAWFTALLLLRPQIHIGWLAGSKFVTILTLIGAGVGVNNVWDTADSSTPAALTTFLVRLMLWAGGLGGVGYWLGLLLLRYNGFIWKWLFGIRTSQRWFMLLGALLATVFGMTLVQETAVPMETTNLINTNTILTILVMAVIGWFAVRWILSLANPVLRIMLEVMLVGLVAGVVLVAFTPIPFTSVSELLLSGGLMGTAAALLIFHRTAAMLMRAMMGALVGALVAAGNLHNDPSQLAVTSWMFVGMITAVLWSRWRESSKQ